MRRQLSHCLLFVVSPQPPVEVTTDEDGETTTEKYRISRAEFGKIVNRNFRGLQKLFRIEVADAKNVSEFFLFNKLLLIRLFFVAISIHQGGISSTAERSNQATRRNLHQASQLDRHKYGLENLST